MSRKPGLGRVAGKAVSFYMAAEQKDNLDYVVSKTGLTASELVRRFFDSYANCGRPFGFKKIVGRKRAS